MTGIPQRILNSGVFWSQAVTALRITGFVAVLGAGVRFMEPAELGLWYLIMNITQLGCAVELGFSGTLARFASYYKAGCQDVPGIGLANPESGPGHPNHPKLAGLIKMAIPFYRHLSLLAAFNVLIIGGVFLCCTEPPKITRAAEWITLIIMGAGSAINLSGLFWHAMLHGMNEVKAHYMLTAAGMMAGYSISIIGLAAGMGLPALAAGFIVMNFIPRFFARRMIVKRIPQTVADTVTSKALWPMTWRSGTSAIANYMTVAFTTVITAHLYGLEAAGQYGLCMQLGLALHTFSASWLAAKTPLLAQFFSQGRTGDIRSIFLSRVSLGMLTFAAGSLFLLFVTEPALETIGAKTMPLPAGLFALLLLLIGMDLWVGFHAAAIQASNRLPHLRIFVLTALASTGLAIAAGQAWGLWGIITGPIVVQLACNYWRTPALFWKHVRNLERSAATP